MKKIWICFFLIFIIGVGLIDRPLRVDAIYTENIANDPKVRYVDIDTKEGVNKEQVEAAYYNVLAVEKVIESKEDFVIYVKKNTLSTIKTLDTIQPIERSGDNIQIKGNSFIINTETSVSKISITTPKGIILDKRSIVPSGWSVSEYETANKKVFELFNSDFINDGTDYNALVTSEQIQKTISDFGKFKLIDSNVLDDPSIQIELSYYPIVLYEDLNETIKLGYFTPYLYEEGLQKVTAYDEIQKLSNPLLALTTSYYYFQGIKAGVTTSLDDNRDYIKQMLNTQRIATIDTYLDGFDVTSQSSVQKYLIKYDFDEEKLTRKAEAKNQVNISIPQPVSVINKDTFGDELSEENSLVNYSLGDNLFNDENEVPKITGYHFIGIENKDEDFPIKITNQKREIVLIYEADEENPIIENYATTTQKWGDVPWKLNNGVLTLNATGLTNPTLGLGIDSPWRRVTNPINPNDIKKIELIGKMKAPEYAAFLFTDAKYISDDEFEALGLSNLEEIEGLTNLDVSNSTDMGSMFHNNRKLKSIDVGNWDVRKCQQFSLMFMNTESITNLDVSKWQLNSATDLYGMFFGMIGLENLDVKNWNTSKVTKTDYTFGKMTSLTELNLTNWDTRLVTTQGAMFANTPKLRKLILGNNTILKNSSLPNSPSPNFTGKWQILGENGTLDNPRGDWSGLSSELEIRTQKVTLSGETYVWQPLSGEINISQYPNSYQFFTNTIDNMPMEKVLEPKNKDVTYIGIKDSRRITSPWELKVAAKELVSTTDENKKINTAKINLTMDLVSFNESGESIAFPSSLDRPDFLEQITLTTDRSSVSIMSLGDDTNNEPQVGDYGLSISDVSLVLPGSVFQEKDVYQSQIIWTLDSVPNPGLLNARENTPETTKIE